MKVVKSVLLLVVGFTSAAAFAGDCVITTTRTACPGKQQESYSKCPGNVQTCSATVAANDQKACADAALKACSNARFDITKYKVVTAKFNNTDFTRGQDFCNRDGATSDASYKYIVRDNFPHRDQADCK
ncbi:MAG: hypothetical protein ACXVB9_01795 [Bdellovibrionota bacterium]